MASMGFARRLIVHHCLLEKNFSQRCAIMALSLAKAEKPGFSVLTEAKCMPRERLLLQSASEPRPASEGAFARGE